MQVVTRPHLWPRYPSIFFLFDPVSFVENATISAMYPSQPSPSLSLLPPTVKPSTPIAEFAEKDSIAGLDDIVPRIFSPVLL